MQLAGRPEDYLTWRTSAPLRTHWRLAGCAEFQCDAYLYGWITVVPGDSVQAEWIRGASARRYTEEATPDGLVRFTFPAGQTCFAAYQHHVPLGRPPVHLVLHGDQRYAVLLRRHSGADPFVDDLRTHLTKLAKEAE